MPLKVFHASSLEVVRWKLLKSVLISQILFWFLRNEPAHVIPSILFLHFSISLHMLKVRSQQPLTMQQGCVCVYKICVLVLWEHLIVCTGLSELLRVWVVFMSRCACAHACVMETLVSVYTTFRASQGMGDIYIQLSSYKF